MDPGAEGGVSGGPGEGDFGGEFGGPDFEGTGDASGMPNSGGWDQTLANISLSTIPFLGPLLGAFNFAGNAQGDPNAHQGVSGPDGGGGVGGGPGEPSNRMGNNNNRLQRPETPPFQLDPNQVLNDIALGSGWGAPIMMPQMNPMGMGQGSQYQNPYGNQANPFNWGSYLQNFGGK